jgi:lipoyl(octanoyl) transferase
MACDEFLYEKACGSEPQHIVLRLYSFKPRAVTIGFSQPMCSDRSIQRTIESYQDVSRRITGGGLVIHGADLPYTCIVHTSFGERLKTVSDSYAFFHGIVQDAFSRCNLRCELHSTEQSSFRGSGRCFASPVKSDLMYNGKKIAGAAQKRKKGWILHQGSIAMDLFSREHQIDQTRFVKELVLSIQDFFSLPVCENNLSSQDIREIDDLMHSKYMSREWILRR